MEDTARRHWFIFQMNYAAKRPNIAMPYANTSGLMIIRKYFTVVCNYLIQGLFLLLYIRLA